MATAPLPARLPLFPLTGALLLPRGRLPLNVFEPRYVNMVDDALAGDRLIGMIQPCESGRDGHDLYRTGCAGRITSFVEEGPRYQIVLTGVSRFDLLEDELTPRGYRLARPDWSLWSEDRDGETGAVADRPRLIAGLKAFFQARELSADWAAIEQTSDERLVNSLAMVCPFEPAEKQALLMAQDLAARAELLTGLVEMGACQGADAPDGHSRH